MEPSSSVCRCDHVHPTAAHDHEHQNHAHSQTQEEHTHSRSDRTLSISTHDQSVVGTYRFRLNGAYGSCSQALSSILQRIGEKVSTSGGLVGHIKAYLTSVERGCVISVTDETADIRPTQTEYCMVEGVAIVFHITPEELEQILRENLPLQ